MMYCNKDDLYEACLHSAIDNWAKDNHTDTIEQISLRVNSAIKRSSEEMNLYLSKKYSLPLPFIPISLRDICVKLSLYQLLSRKGFSTDDLSIKVNYDSAIKQLEYIANGKLDIGITPPQKPSSNPSYHFPTSSFLNK